MDVEVVRPASLEALHRFVVDHGRLVELGDESLDAAVGLLQGFYPFVTAFGAVAYLKHWRSFVSGVVNE